MFDQNSLELVPVIGILRGFSPEQVEQIIPIYIEAGFTTIEITMNSEGAIKMIKNMVKAYGAELNIGAGTVRTSEELDAALSAGAEFIVCPIVNPEVIQKAVTAGVPVFPGAYTPTEVFSAWQMGAAAVKVFPAETGGLQHIKALQAPLEMIPLVATGGVDADNLASFFDSGVYAVGMGSQLFPKNLIHNGQWSLLGSQLKKVRDAYDQWKKGI